MNKLEEYKMQFSIKPEYKSGWLATCVREGFDAAMALDLPVKFAEWLSNNSRRIDGVSALFKVKNLEGHHSIKSIYQYWLDNIYNPEL